MHCKYCAAVVKKGSTVCPQCGKPIEVVKKSKKKAVGWVIAIIVAVCILALLAVLAVVGILAGSGLILFNLPTGKGNNTITLPVPQKPGNQAATVVGKEELSAKNPFKLVYMSYDSYVLPNSNSRYLCYADIQKLSEGELLIAEQEIYARYGMVFSDAHLQEYFEARDWYSSGSGRFIPNSFEQANLDLFQITRDKKDGKLSQYGNKYINAYPIADGYVIRDSNRRVLNGSELERLTETQLCIARNEILARHGWIFDDTELREYFYSKTWYVPTVSGTAFDYDCLTGTESSNISLIKSYENHTVSVEWSVDNPYVDVYYKYRYQNYIFSNSSHQTLTKSDLYGMTEDELCIARNEIWARHGYTFKSDNLMQYFMHFDWYIPTTAMGDSSSLYLNSVEKANFDLIQDAEETAAKNPYKIFEQESIYVPDTPTTPTNGITQIDQYTYVNGEWCYHIPVVNLPGVNADSINQKMYNTHYNNLKENAFSAYPCMIGMVYSVAQKGDIVSVFVRNVNDTGCHSHYVYNFSATTGAELSDREVFEAFGMTEAEGREQIKSAIGILWDKTYGMHEGWQERREDTVAEENVNECHPYINSNGELMYSGWVHSMAGAEGYMYSFDGNGNERTLTCSIH